VAVPDASRANQRKAIDPGGEPRQCFDVVVADDAEDGNVDLRQLFDRLLEGAKRLEARVGALDDVAGEDDGIDARLDRPAKTTASTRV